MAGIKKILTAVISLVIGIIFIVVSILLLSKNANTNYAEITGTIVDITEEWNPTADVDEDQYDHHTFVDYTVDGKEYKHVELGQYSSTMKIGDKVDFLYNVDDPAEISSKGGKLFGIIGIVAGVLIIVIGIFSFLRRI